MKRFLLALALTGCSSAPPPATITADSIKAVVAACELVGDAGPGAKECATVLETKREVCGK